MNRLKWDQGRNQKVSQNKWKWTHNPKPMGHSKSSPKREVHSNTGLPKEDRKISNKQPNPTSKRTRGTTTNKAQSRQKELNNKDQRRIKWHRHKYKNKNKNKNSKDQWIQELVPLKDKQNWQTVNQIHQAKKGRDPNKIRTEREVTTDTTEINTKDFKKLL